MNYETTGWSGGNKETVVVDDSGPARRRRRNIILAAVAAFVVLVAAVVFYMQGQQADSTKVAVDAKAGSAGGPGAAGGQVPRVSVIVPGRQQVARLISATGTLAARRDLPVGIAGEGGLVSRVLVEPGQWVRAGQTLAVIERSVQSQEANQLAASIDVARADARLAQQELERAQALVSRGFVSKADVERRIATRDAANARVRVATAQLGASRARIGRLDVRAPAAGLVLDRNVEAGQVVSSGSGPLFRIAQGGEMELVARLSQEDLARLNAGVPATITPVGATTSFQGRVWQVSPIIDPQTRQGDARILVPYTAALRPGGFASAEIRAGAYDAPLLPESAVQSDAKGNFVYIVDQKNEVVRRAVTVGEVSDLGVAVMTGLTGAERVVQSAGAFLNPGQKVVPIRAVAAAR
ncbi:MAG TPA: efflux RND transporter periplasmic adaptor subunit [Allosphingosinicella sp.]